jgi:PAS domain S-box-containing protein
VKTRLLFAAGSIAIAAAAASLGLVLASNHDDNAGARAALIVGLGLIFVASGLIAIVRRPDNRIGLLMVIVGFFWFLTSLADANERWLYTIGVAVSLLIYGGFAHVILAFPTGRLDSPRVRAIVLLAYLDITIVQWALMLFRPRIGVANRVCADCPQNGFLVTSNHAAATAVDDLQRGIALALLIAAFTTLYRRVRNATPAARRTLLPVVITATTSIALIGILVVASSFSASLARTLNWFVLGSFAAVPLGFLVGLLQSRLARSGILRLVVDTPDEPSLREAELALREATGDPSLRLAYWLDDVRGYVNVRGKPFVIPEDTPNRVTTRVDYGDEPIAALMHDRALLDDPGLLEEVLGVVRMGLQKDRGERALRATELRSRALLDAIPDLMFRISVEGRYLDFRAPNEDDLVAREVLGKTVWDRLPRELANHFVDLGRRAIQRGEVQSLEYELDFDGDLRYYEARMAASGDDEFVVIVRNITERKLQEQELQASRARIVAAGDEERRRLERNLHDGAQQRLVSLSLALRLAQNQVRTNPDDAEQTLESARDELAQALDELRELARGLHPAILTDRGLGSALEALAARAPLPVEIERADADLPAPVEVAAYYVVSEALTNVAKYANASWVRVSVAQTNGSARVLVTDDGVGGADPAAGTGLRGLADRIAAMNGTLEIDSHPGAGTVIRADIPLAVT